MNVQVKWPVSPYSIVALCLALLATSLADPSVLLAQESSSRKAVAIYADAAAFQNNAAYELAIEEWQKLIKEFPRDPLIGKAWHYLGVCYIQLDAPEYQKAISAFSKALEDSKLEVKEEALINLCWCLFSRARDADEGSSAQRRGLEEAKSGFQKFLSQYRDGSYVDQALFYLGEIEYALGNTQRAVGHYRSLLESRSLRQSALRPDARYAIAVAYEELNDKSRANREYQTFLKDHQDHRLVAEVRLRLADLLLGEQKAFEAEQLLNRLVGTEGDMADYAVLRLGYALEQQQKLDSAANRYRELLRKYPDSEHVRTAALSLGQILYRQGDNAAAIESFEQVLASKDEQAASAAHWLAVTLMKENKIAEAEKILASALRWAGNTSNVATLRLDYADALYADPAKLSEARKAYEKVASEYADSPLAPRAAYNAAFGALQEGDYRLARNWAETFLSKYPNDALRVDVAYVAAEALLQEGEHAAAAQAYEKLRAVDRSNPAYPLWNLRLGMANYLDGKYAAAIQVLDSEFQNFKSNEQRAEAKFIIGASHLYQEDTTTAIKNLKESHLSSDRWNSADEVLLLLAEAYQRNAENDEAKSTLEKLLQKYPGTRLKAKVNYKLAQLSAALGQLDAAISKYNAIVSDAEAESFHRFANYGVVWCQMQREEYNAALSRLGLILNTKIEDSISSEAKLAEGICLRKLGRLDEAERSLESYLRKDVRGEALANGLYELGLTLTEKGEKAAANRVFERIRNEVPGYPAMDKVLYEIGWNLEESSSDGLSNKYFRLIAEQFPNSEFAGEAIYMLGQKEYEEEDYQRAATTYTSVLGKTSDPELLEKSQYKLGWSLFQMQRYPEAAGKFQEQATKFPRGSLVVDALFMLSECAFKEDRFSDALSGYKQARQALESAPDQSAASDQVRVLIYLHAAQCLREAKRWNECEDWIGIIRSKYPATPYMPTALYELGFCKQKKGQLDQALKLYADVANNYRNEIAARSRFMMGEVYFERRDYLKAIPEFQRVMYGFGGDNAPESIKNWQVRSAFEAARCSEVLISKLGGEGREKVKDSAQEFYLYIVEKHAAHELASKAQNRLGELKRLR